MQLLLSYVIEDCGVVILWKGIGVIPPRDGKFQSNFLDNTLRVSIALREEAGCVTSSSLTSFNRFF